MKTIDGTPGSRTVRRCVAALVTVFATLAIALSPGTAMAAAGWRQHQWHPRTADVTFTKWVVTLPTDPSTLAGVQMAGIAGGDVGRGLYRGQVFSDDTVTQPGFWLAHVRYDFFGRDHWLIADLHVTEDDRGAPITATIQGFVAAGWMFGAQVTGQYTRWDTCPIPTPGNVFGTTCFVGTLHLRGVLWS
jgi:hypothetical protein